MRKKKILRGVDNPLLRERAEEVRKFGSELRKLVGDMKKTMQKAKGLGLAAPQIGVLERVFLVTLSHQQKGEIVVAMVNPEILFESEDLCLGEEGCLSIPGEYAKVLRPCAVKVRFFDVEGNEMMMDLEGLDARVVMHENDHLNGVLFVDRIEEQGELNEEMSNVL